MYCKNCGKQIPDDSKFCRFCGEKLELNSGDSLKDTDKKRKVVFDGEVHKCPNCGEILDAFVTKCPSCGYEVRGTKGGINKVEELAYKLQNTDSISKKKELISNFYVPNTKEDIFEFFALAISQIGDDNACSEAWHTKLDQTLFKAKISFGDNDDYRYLLELYNVETRKKDRTSHRKKAAAIMVSLLLGLLSIGGFILMGIAFTMTDPNNPDDTRFAGLAIAGMFLGLGCMFGLIGFLVHISNKNKKDKSRKEGYDNYSQGKSSALSNKTTSKSTKKQHKVIVEESKEGDNFRDKKEKNSQKETEDVSSTNESKSLKQEFKDVGKEFVEMFKSHLK